MILFLSILLALVTIVLAFVALASVDRPALAAAWAPAVKWLVIMLVFTIGALVIVPVFV